MSLRLRPVFRCFYSCKFRFLTTQENVQSVNGGMQEPEVKIIRREMIKPAFRMPRQRKTTYKLSLLDQIIPPFHFPLVFFYPNNRNTGNIDLIKNILKQSIAETLTLFYPLAGKIKDDLWIDCNDEGMYYVEARINSHLSEVLDLSRPNYQMIYQLVPRVSPTEMEPKTEGVYVVMVQLNIFDCGGIALALSTSHKIMDGYTVDTFLKSGVASARGTPQPGHLNLAASHLFPQNISLPKDSKLFTWPPLFKEGDCVTRRLVFDGSALVALKAKAASSSSSLVQNPTRIEVVSGLL
ncbi:shikimate O-hydroxycinnamoyltransferase [Sarracenia purpurea var. burkii]